MPRCDLCGKEAKLVRAEIEGSEFNVCENCGKYGIILGEAEKEKPAVVLLKKRRIIREEVEERVMVGFAEKIRKAREKKGMKQEEFGKFLNEKVSVVQKWEAGTLRPNILTAKRLERILGVDLVEKVERKKVNLSEVKSGEVTLGDVIKIRKRKSAKK